MLPIPIHADTVPRKASGDLKVTPRYLITSALPYINGMKHLGNLAGSMLPADVYARFCRQLGRKVLYICATDEHGTPAELAAAAAGLPVAEYCPSRYELQKAVSENFAISWDYFGRSSSGNNRELTQHFARKLEESGFIEERVVEQVYSLDDGRFLPDRYIVGTCPHCGYDLARGDQCEGCTRLLDPHELQNARSAISGSTNLEVRKSRHLFLLQSKLTDTLRSWIDSHEDWPRLVTSIARKWLDEGLHDRCITRDLDWGVPVDRKGFEDKVFYVWFDAPIEYIAATKSWAEGSADRGRWEDWWKSEDQSSVYYVQFMAKDNIPFHTVGFPVTLFGSGESWKVVDYLKGFNWLTYYGGKFSTSQRRGIFMDDALDLFPADYWRYYLTANAPESNDVSFSWEHFAETVNKDLADVFGNFVNRCLKFCEKRFGPKIPAGGQWGIREEELAQGLEARVAALKTALDSTEFRKAMSELRAIWVLGNNYLTRAAPWSAAKENPEDAEIALRTSINLIRLYALYSYCVVPNTSIVLLEALNIPSIETDWPTDSMRAELSALKGGHPFSVPDILFEKVQEEEIEQLTRRFGS